MINLLGYMTFSEVRFVVAIILTLIFSATLNKRTGYLHTFCAILIVYITFDYLQMAYVCTALIINLSLLFIFHLKEYPLTVVNFLILYIFKLKGKDFEPKIVGTCDISGVLMLTTIKMSYLGKEYDRKKHKISDVIGYLLFIPGLILGPTCTFLEFVETPYPIEVSSPLPTLGISFIFLVLLKTFQKYYPVDILYDSNINLGHKLLNIYFFNLGQRCKFYFVWHYSNGCYLLQGFNDMLNIKFFEVETARSIKDLSQGWNIKTNRWLKECYFDKLKNRSIFWASFVTFTVSALWHGIKPGYLIMFLSFCFAIPVLKGINTLMLAYIPFAFPVLSRIQMVLFTMYFCIPFFLLEVPNLMFVWRSVYFYGHIYCILGFVIYYLHNIS
jgi:hypothetical protein